LFPDIHGRLFDIQASDICDGSQCAIEQNNAQTIRRAGIANVVNGKGLTIVRPFFSKRVANSPVSLNLYG
jgi:hypothetical protein